MNLELRLTLKSDAAFGRGDGTIGLVDSEVEHDEYGMPFLRGRTLKGLLVEECANILFALETKNLPVAGKLSQAGKFLFGQAGSALEDEGLMHVGPALLPKELREAVKIDIKSRRLTPAAVLDSLTAIRSQTAVNENGAPDEGSLRSIRTILRKTVFIAELSFARQPEPDALGLLAGCGLGLRQGGTGRNRGLGRMEARIYDSKGTDVTQLHFGHFKKSLGGRDG